MTRTRRQLREIARLDAMRANIPSTLEQIFAQIEGRVPYQAAAIPDRTEDTGNRAGKAQEQR